MATAWLFHDSLVRQAPVSRQPSCYRVNLCHLIVQIIAFHQKYWSVDAALVTEVSEIAVLATQYSSCGAKLLQGRGEN